jgi:hypothetical protein
MRESKRSLIMLLVVCCAVAILVGCNGFQGHVYERLPDGSVGPVIAGAAITFVSEDGSFSETVVSDSGGSYKITLDPERYVVTVTHPSYHDTTFTPGFFVCTGKGYQTANIFMK